MRSLVLAASFLILTLSISEAHARSFFENDSSGEQKTIDIPYREQEIGAGPLMSRNVKFQIPQGRRPRSGWPAVVIYQGTNLPVQFRSFSTDAFGQYYETVLIKMLLENGFAVLAPPAIWDVGWVTNIATVGFEVTSDYFFIQNVLKAVEHGVFGPLDMTRIYATGISSGGYNTSRMAVSFPGRFRALAIHSGSYATCLGAVCQVPSELPKDHPPTLFLYGEKDFQIPKWTVNDYYQSLKKNHIPTHVLSDPNCGHEWCSGSPAAIVEWFSYWNRL